MKKLLIGAAAAIMAVGCTLSPRVPSAEEVKQVSQRVADWQLAHFEDQHLYRAPRGNSVHDNKVYHDLQWQNAAFYAGLYQFTTITDDLKYLDWLSQMSRNHGYKLHAREFHADDHAVGQFYLNLYEYYGKPELFQPLRRQFDKMLKNEKANDMHWWWCDALFMSPPVWARLSKVTGDMKYLEYMDSQYHMTYDRLWSEENSLFFRDKKYLDKHEANGESLFWARGNGWVFGGLALIIPEMPEDWSGRQFYIDLYKSMAKRLKAIQREDGTWSAGLLGGVEAYPTIETSGTSFFTFGIAWGINNGLLDRQEYEPVLLKAWDTLSGAVNEEGMLTYVQAVAGSPGGSSAEYTEAYGSGAFLAAGAEMHRFIKKFYETEKAPRTDATESETFMTHGGWCWYQGPRAAISNGKLVIGGIDGISGDVRVSIYDLENEKIDGEVTLEAGFECDDHNAPAIYARPDGSVLAMWATHGTDKIHRMKVTSPDDYLNWGEQIEYMHEYEDPRGVTYMNLYYLKDQDNLFCFFRDGPNFNPAYVISKDHGKSWGSYTHLIANEVHGRQRPYTIYSQADENTVGIVYTDGHPRQYGNSLYYVEFRNGKFYKADGSLIHDLKDGPLPTTHGEKIFKGSEVQNKPITCESVPESGWNCNMITDAEGNPHIGYTLYKSNHDHRFGLLSWDGEKWHDREIAYGGRCLYYWESSYTGLMTIDPDDPEIVYISTDVNPSTGEYMGGVHEIYKGRVGINDNINTIKWEAVTSGSTYRNIRPIIVAKDGYKVLLWLNGNWWTYLHYDVDVRGQILERP